MQIVNILKKIWPYAIIGIALLIFLPDLTAITKELAAFIAGVIGFLFWSKRTKLDTEPDKIVRDEHENLSDIRLKEAISELEQIGQIRDNIKEQAEKITPMPDEPAPGKSRKVFKVR
jgi:hypothetical protein